MDETGKHYTKWKKTEQRAMGRGWAHSLRGGWGEPGE